MDPFRQLKKGERIPGIPSAPWNRMVDGQKGHPLGKRPEGLAEGAVEFDVINDTDEAVPQYGVLKLDSPLTGVEQSLDDFLQQDTMRGASPELRRPFVVLQQAALPGEVVRARLRGLTRVQVNIGREEHRHAAPYGSTSELVSRASGPARIVYVQPDLSGSDSPLGTKWCVVELGHEDGDETGFVMPVFSPPIAGKTPAFLFDQIGLVDEWPVAEQVFLVPANEDVELTPGRRYLARKGLDEFQSKAVWAAESCCDGEASGSPEDGCPEPPIEAPMCVFFNTLDPIDDVDEPTLDGMQVPASVSLNSFSAVSPRLRFDCQIHMLGMCMGTTWLVTTVGIHCGGDPTITQYCNWRYTRLMRFDSVTNSPFELHAHSDRAPNGPGFSIEVREPSGGGEPCDDEDNCDTEEGCFAVADTLYGLLTVVSGSAPGLDGQVITIFSLGNCLWIGTIAGGLTLQLTGTSTIEVWHVELGSSGDNCEWGVDSDVEYTATPFEVVAEFTFVASAMNNCADDGTVLNVTITDVPP